MLLSRSGEYALRALIDLAGSRDSGPRPTAEIAEAIGVPQNYLSKLLYQLAQAGVLESTRGPQGGFRLAHAPEDLTLAEALETIDAERLERRCLLGRPQCSDADPCSAHERWRALADQVSAFLESTTLADLQRPTRRARRGRKRSR
jgi:Rrf2 family iron-sulfur cluster assembly transcriptional regulator